MIERVDVAAISFMPKKFGLEANADQLETMFRQAAAECRRFGAEGSAPARRGLCGSFAGGHRRGQSLPRRRVAQDAHLVDGQGWGNAVPVESEQICLKVNCALR